MNQPQLISTADMIETFQRGINHLNNMAKKTEIAWNPGLQDPRRLHNMYVRNLFTSYVSRFSELGNGVLAGIQQKNYLVYALCGRALKETTAILRYYVIREYKPLQDKGNLNARDMKMLLEIDDRHLRGTGFDWSSFMFRRYSQLRENARKRRGHKTSDRRTVSGAMPEYMPIRRCIDSWSKEDAIFGVSYDLFCDMVHPCAGSSFLVASTGTDGLYFSKFKGDRVGAQIVEQSLPILITTTMRPFGDYLEMLIGTVVLEDGIV